MSEGWQVLFWDARMEGLLGSFEESHMEAVTQVHLLHRLQLLILRGSPSEGGEAIAKRGRV